MPPRFTPKRRRRYSHEDVYQQPVLVNRTHIPSTQRSAYWDERVPVFEPGKAFDDMHELWSDLEVMLQFQKLADLSDFQLHKAVHPISRDPLLPFLTNYANAVADHDAERARCAAAADFDGGGDHDQDSGPPPRPKKKKTATAEREYLRRLLVAVETHAKVQGSGQKECCHPGCLDAALVYCHECAVSGCYWCAHHDQRAHGHLTSCFHRRQYVGDDNHIFLGPNDYLKANTSKREIATMGV
jgi:hypothetical protein